MLIRILLLLVDHNDLMLLYLLLLLLLLGGPLMILNWLMLLHTIRVCLIDTIIISIVVGARGES